jgi:hypothetical protein
MAKLVSQLFIILLFCISCRNNKNSKPLDISKNTSSSNVDTLEIKKQYENGKWWLYCIYCDDTVRFEPRYKVLDTITFSQLSLKQTFIRKNKDTLEISYCFYYHDSIPCLQDVIKNRPFHSVVFIGNDIKPFEFGDNRGYMWDRGTSTRLNDPIKPEVIKFIRENADKLNPWFG